MRDAIRDVFKDPDIGDAISVDGDTLVVERIERHQGKTHVVVQINGNPGRRRYITKESWREYRDDAEIVTNRSLVDAFDE